MLNFIKNFRNDEDGAVTVDFVVLTAAIVLLGLAVGTAITGAANKASGNVVTEIGKSPTTVATGG
ncbi:MULTISPECIES: hypothetical protein [unclassified Yoonia]|uniref:Flp family type IVb pilin n=1 Tax=unclassified Yoonia TaxID=2629118 RepID=UPI002AFF76F7|nr:MULTISPECIES: hypothetical protein [unclassified Yoonia]